MPDNQNNRDDGQKSNNSIESALANGDLDAVYRFVEDKVQVSVNGVMEKVQNTLTNAANQVQSAVNDAANQAFQSGNRATGSFQAGASSANAFHPGNVNNPRNNTQKNPGAVPYGNAANRTTTATRYGGSSIPYTNTAGKAEARPFTPWVEKAKAVPIFKKIGNVSGTLLQIFGSIGAGIFGFVLFILLMVTIFGGDPFSLIGVDIGFGAAVAGFVAMILKGAGNKDVLYRAQIYYELCQKTGYRNISELAASAGKSEKFVVKELKKLIAKGVFPQGHLDEEEKCFMITNAAFVEYRQIAIERKAQEEAERIAAESARKLSEEEKQLQAMIVEGREYISQIRQKNDAIPGEVFSQKLYRMEDLLKEIFVNLEKHPEQMSRMHRLMNYYLPTTLKLVSAYEEFDQLSVQGEDVTDAKREIENTVDTINDAFGEILNKLFAHTAMDVTTDAQVLKTMLAREGLTRDEINKEEKEYVYELR